MSKVIKGDKDGIMPLSDFAYDLMWTSWRYCIGRHSYVTAMAYDIAQNFYRRMDDLQMATSAKDIRNCIYEAMRFSPVDYTIDYSVREEDRLPAEFLIEYFISNGIYGIGDLKEKKIRGVEVYKDKCADPDVKYNTIYDDSPIPSYSSHMDFALTDILPWMNLASLFDKKRYKVVTAERDGVKEDILAFESYVEEYEPIAGKPGYVQQNQGHWKKVYVGVDDFASHPYAAGYIFPGYIVNVKDWTPDE